MTKNQQTNIREVYRQFSKRIKALTKHSIPFLEHSQVSGEHGMMVHEQPQCLRFSRISSQIASSFLKKVLIWFRKTLKEYKY